MSAFRLTTMILLVSAVAMAIGAFVIIDGGDSVEVSGESGSFGDGMEWNLDDDGKLTITGSGIIEWQYEWSSLTIKIVEISEGVTGISGDLGSVFRGCTVLTSVTIPNSVTRIDEGVFEGCTSLQRIDVADSNESYSSDDGILFDKAKTVLMVYPAGRTATSYSIPGSVTTVGYAAFEDCINLTSVTIPNSVTVIRDYGFNRCSGLVSIDVSDSLTSIGGAAFANCSGLTEFEFPDGLESIGNSAFSACTGLTSVAIPDSVTTIENYAFNECSELTSFKFPDRITTIGNSILRDTGLTSVAIPDSVTTIKSFAFTNCDKLLKIRFGEGVTSMIEDGRFYSFTNHTFYAEDGLTVLDLNNPADFAGYEFVGLSTDKMIRSTPVIEHHVTYVADGGSVEAPTQDDVQEGQRFTVKDYAGTRTGYTFGGWSYGGTTYKAGDTIEMGASDIVLEAVWMENQAFVPIPGDDPEIPIIPEKSPDDDDAPAAIIAAGCVVVLLAILVLVGSTRIGR